MDLIKTFDQISKDDVAIAGGKGASLGEMSKAGIPVPPGFIITSKAYKQFYNTELPADFIEEIYQAFEKLGAQRVAVRSSAVAEDSKTASWAGQLESYLNTTKADLIENIRKCWNSIKSDRALSYAAHQDLNEEDLIVAVVVQKMVNSESSGVMFTINPVTGNRDELMIEAGWGLGEMLVQGMITPDNFIVDKQSLEITSKDIQEQEMMMVTKEVGNVEVAVPVDQRLKPALTDGQVRELAVLGKKIEDHYGSPQDIEWALEGGQLFIVQSRPVTTL